MSFPAALAPVFPSRGGRIEGAECLLDALGAQRDMPATSRPTRLASPGPGVCSGRPWGACRGTRATPGLPPSAPADDGFLAPGPSREGNDGGHSTLYDSSMSDAPHPGTTRWTPYQRADHIVWIPKCRRKILVGEVDTAGKALIGECRDRHGFWLPALETDVDQGHCSVSGPPRRAPATMKGPLGG
jgi:hypothetical protein